eukprot:5781843-Amphidinium_carterae.1
MQDFIGPFCCFGKDLDSLGFEVVQRKPRNVKVLQHAPVDQSVSAMDFGERLIRNILEARCLGAGRSWKAIATIGQPLQHHQLNVLVLILNALRMINSLQQVLKLEMSIAT